MHSYLIDEPSAYLDSEQRIIASRMIKRFVLHSRTKAAVVEHDFVGVLMLCAALRIELILSLQIMATYLADRVIVFEGVPSVHAKANSPESLLTGMNSFMARLEVSMRRDPTNFRPRINKMNSVKDKEQKSSGKYFFIGEDA